MAVAPSGIAGDMTAASGWQPIAFSSAKLGPLGQGAPTSSPLNHFAVILCYVVLNSVRYTSRRKSQLLFYAAKYS
jgi:hypothetical protein